MTKDVLNAKKAKREAEAKLEERNSFIEELQVFFSKIIYSNDSKEKYSELSGSVKLILIIANRKFVYDSRNLSIPQIIYNARTYLQLPLRQ